MQLTTEQKKAIQDSLQLAEKMVIMPIATKDDYLNAEEAKNTVRNHIKELENKRMEITRSIDAAKKMVMNFFSPAIDKWKDLLDNLKSEMLKYHQEQERIRLEQEEALRKKQEAEAKRLRDRAAKAKKEETKDRLEEQAEQAETIQPIIPKFQSNGSHTRIVWKAEVVNFAELPDEYKIANEPMLNKLAKNSQGKLKIKGVKFYKEIIMV